MYDRQNAPIIAAADAKILDIFPFLSNSWFSVKIQQTIRLKYWSLFDFLKQEKKIVAYFWWHLKGPQPPIMHHMLHFISDQPLLTDNSIHLNMVKFSSYHGNIFLSENVACLLCLLRLLCLLHIFKCTSESFILFDLILYVLSTIFQLCRDRSSWIEPVLS